MDSIKEEALKAKEIAEKRFAEKDFAGAKNYALKAKSLWPGLDGISQMVATFDVYVASVARFNGDVDYYSILGLKPTADKYAVKRQYRKLAVLLHPDNNKSVGADGAFKLVSEAWTLLSDNAKRGSYDLNRNQNSTSVVSTSNLSSVPGVGFTGHYNSHSPVPQARLDTFWTVCTSCKVQYEYLRKYVNKRLSCKNCRGVFIAVETGTAPINGSFPYSAYSYAPDNGYGNHGSDNVSYVHTNSTYYSTDNVGGYHSGQGYEYISDVSFHWNSVSSNSTVIMGPNSSPATATDTFFPANGKVHKAKYRTGKGRNDLRDTVVSIDQQASDFGSGSSGSVITRPDKRRKVVVGMEFRNGPDGILINSPLEVNGELPTRNDVTARPSPVVPAIEVRKLLIAKARTEIQKKLKEMKLADDAATDKAIQHAEAAHLRGNASIAGSHSKPGKHGPVSITVPDPDFHDFDKDRLEECFLPRQVWALYDEEDGMPRLYCLIREVMSVKPFKILISYLSSRTDSEFGPVHWIDRGFTKSCGHFRAHSSDTVEQVNIFSHMLGKEKAGRGGCVRIFPRRGEIWAVYRHWSPDWTRSTPAEQRYQFEMVEIVDAYTEELGVCVTPLEKLAGYKTVYRRKDAARWIPRKEMLRFSHQVPSWSLKGEAGNLPDGCWDLDPAATPDELLHAELDQKAT
ncbi:hypothetical protein MLD38_025769 [Melastoma candidum]|uniref:Uncharacterized protein n=1 Tax=Melastoma candidum TaxID=119954 RepID=A0ACB9NY03_9MYRT|nr:hypothetical protein MLD38_025769 [Melastoma candidum]